MNAIHRIINASVHHWDRSVKVGEAKVSACGGLAVTSVVNQFDFLDNGGTECGKSGINACDAGIMFGAALSGLNIDTRRNLVEFFKGLSIDTRRNLVKFFRTGNMIYSPFVGRRIVLATHGGIAVMVRIW